MRHWKGLGIWTLALLMLHLLHAPASRAGSPFYLTVERGFSTAERPTVRLDYSDGSQPLVLRVLRPASLEGFLEGQLNISRSYEAPTTALNPGHFLAKGLNRVSSPLRGLRDLLSPGFRAKFADTPLSHAIVDTSQREIAAVPEAVIHSPPKGFSLVREVVVDLQYGGESAHDLGWWFAASAWREDRYKVRRIPLDPLPDGIYLLQGVQGKAEAQCLMQVSSLALQVKQSSRQLVVRVIDRQQRPVAGATVSVRDGRGRWYDLPANTDAAGELLFDNPDGVLDGKLLVRAHTADGRRALADTDFLPSVSDADAVYILTDRPIFKPGESFQFKGLVRAQEQGRLRVPAPPGDGRAHIRLIRADGADMGLSAEAALTEFGSFSGSLTLDDAQAPGLYRLVARLGDTPYGGELRVRDYVKPSFYLELIERSPAVVPGERFSLRFRARRYSGGAPPEAKFEVFLYRKQFEAPDWVAEAGAGLEAGGDYHGEVRSASALAEPRRIFSSVEARLAAAGENVPVNTWDGAPLLESDGQAAFAFDVPAAEPGPPREWIYTLMVRVMDRAGAMAVLTEPIYATLAEAQPAVRFSRTVAPVGAEDVEAALRSTYPDGQPAPRASGMLEVTLERAGATAGEVVRLPFTTDARGLGRVALPAVKEPGRVSAVASLERIDNRPIRRVSRSRPALLVVGGSNGEALSPGTELDLMTEREVLSPGERVRLLALLPAGWGDAEKGTLWQTIAGERIHATRAFQINGRSAWFEVEARPEYGTGFYHSLSVPLPGGKYAEKTLGFRIVPGEQRLNVAISPERREAEPLMPLRIELAVSDAQGRPCPDTELAVMVVDRAVYALQPEIRPGILDFFYPLPRLNVATFFSDELQGYGYADLLKTPNFSLGALKSQSRLAKRAMRDTAGWFPHVVTDVGGRATITVDMPANVTEWLVTAVAADKSGRMGESTARLRTVVDVSREALAPQFLRQGEEAALQIRTSNHLERELRINSRLETDPGLRLVDGPAVLEAAVAGRGEHLWPLRLVTEAAAGTALLTVASRSEAGVRLGGPESFEIPLKPAALNQVFSARQEGERLRLSLPDSAAVREARIEVSSGLLGAALGAAATLVAYPYGCTEQLVHATVPNLVLMDLVRRAGIAPQGLGPLAEPLTRAERNAAVGIQRVIRNQKSGGGFGLWPGDADASLPVTLTALHALKFAAELKIESAQPALTKGLEWLAQVKPVEALAPAGHPLHGYELARWAASGCWTQPWEQQIAFVQGVLRAEEAPARDLSHALRIVVEFQDQPWNRFNRGFDTLPLRQELVRRLQRALAQFDMARYGRQAAGEAERVQDPGFGLLAPSVVAAGMGLLAELDALPPELERRLGAMLLAGRRNGCWVSTFDSAQVIFALRPLLSREAKAAAEGGGGRRRVIARSADGRELGELARVPGGYVGIFPDPGGPQQLETIRLEGLEERESAQARVTADVPFAAVVPRSQGLIVERELLRLTGSGTEPLDAQAALALGDTLVSLVRVRRDPAFQGQTVPGHFIVVEDGVPSLARPVEEDRRALADAGIQPPQENTGAGLRETQRHPDRTLRVARLLPGGELRIAQAWQAAFAGRATIPPARAFEMYDESCQGNSAAQAIRVE
jgi:hypothetical protein